MYWPYLYGKQCGAGLRSHDARKTSLLVQHHYYHVKFAMSYSFYVIVTMNTHTHPHTLMQSGWNSRFTWLVYQRNWNELADVNGKARVLYLHGPFHSHEASDVTTPKPSSNGLVSSKELTVTAWVWCQICQKPGVSTVAGVLGGRCHLRHNILSVKHDHCNHSHYARDGP